MYLKKYFFVFETDENDERSFKKIEEYYQNSSDQEGGQNAVGRGWNPLATLKLMKQIATQKRQKPRMRPIKQLNFFEECC